SVYWEIRGLFYVGALAILIGCGLVTREYFAQIGPLVLTAALAAGSFACLGYCFAKGAPYSPDEAASPTVGFDYVLYVGCGLFGLALGTLEGNFHVLQDRWSYYAFLSACVYGALAYRFDNRLVLSLALTTLAGWCGLALNAFGLMTPTRVYPI